MNQSVASEVAVFAEVAKRFCETMETPPTSPAANLRQLQVLLAELHLAALRLPDLSSDESAPELNSDGSKIADGRLSLPCDFYWDVFEPLAADPESPVGNSTADDLSDIYDNVKLGLLHWEQGFPQEACWQWRFLFHFHWGEHLTGFLRALYWAVREDPSLAEDAS